MKDRSLGSLVFDFSNTIFMVLISLVFIIPFIHLVSSSLSDPIQLMTSTGVLLWPKGFSLKGYHLALNNRNILNGFMNTFFYVSVGTCMNLIFTCMIAYVLSRKNLLFRNFMMFLLVFTMFFDGGLIPFYLLVRGIGLYDNRMVLIIPRLVSVMNVIIVRTSFMNIPDSLAESAQMDGANHFTILFRIIIPVSKAMLSVIGLFYAVNHWNAWFHASIFLRDRTKFPLQLVLREILILHDMSSKVSESVLEASELDFYRDLVKYAVTVIATAPILILYPFIQKNFTKGVMIGSIKG